jgi:hypothetical protein
MRRGYRYWAILAAKLVGIGVFAWALWLLAYATIFRVELFARESHKLPASMAALLIALCLPGLLLVIIHLALRDQRFRCRVCGRRLRMPISHGKRSRPFSDPPGMDYICTYGHGKLVTEMWVSGDPPDEWTEYGDIWDELFAKPEKR